MKDISLENINFLYKTLSKNKKTLLVLNCLSESEDIFVTGACLFSPDSLHNVLFYRGYFNEKHSWFIDALKYTAENKLSEKFNNVTFPSLSDYNLMLSVFSEFKSLNSFLDKILGFDDDDDDEDETPENGFWSYVDSEDKDENDDDDDDDDDEDEEDIEENEISNQKDNKDSKRLHKLAEVYRIYSGRRKKVSGEIYRKFPGFFSKISQANWKLMLPIIKSMTEFWLDKILEVIKPFDRDNRKSCKCKFTKNNCTLSPILLKNTYSTKDDKNLIESYDLDLKNKYAFVRWNEDKDKYYNYENISNNSIIPVDPLTGLDSNYNVFTSSNKNVILARLTFMSKRFKNKKFGLAIVNKK